MKATDKIQDPPPSGSHTPLIPSTREVETGVILLGGERNRKGKRQELTRVWSLRIPGDSISPFWPDDLIEVKGLSSDWLLYFYDLQN